MPASGGEMPIEGDLFGKLYTYEELQVIELPKRQKPDWARDLTVPAHWPQDGTTVDPGKWVFWLPDGWGQGIKPTSGGKTLKCFVSPEPMKRIFHKPEVVKYCALMGWSGIKEEEKDDTPKEKKIRTVHDAVPTWPEWELPKDWRVGFKQLPSGPHKIYIPPGQDEGFLYHRTCVEAYLTVGKNLTMFAESKPMAQRSAEKLEAGKQPKKRKIERKVAVLDDYAECKSLALVTVPVASGHNDAVRILAAAGIPGAEDVVIEAVKLHGLLVARGFSADTEIIAVCSLSKTGLQEIDTNVDRVCGLYYRTASLSTEDSRPMYQKIELDSSSTSITCHGRYILWSKAFEQLEKGAWKIGSMDGGFAINQDDQPNPLDCKSAWRIYTK